MIGKMSKYDFVLYAAQSEDFIERLRELGLVDITTTGWEPSEETKMKKITFPQTKLSRSMMLMRLNRSISR